MMYVNFVVILFVVSVFRTQAFFIRVSNPLEDSLMGANVKENELLADISQTRNYEPAVENEKNHPRIVEDDDNVSDIEIPETPADWGWIDGNDRSKWNVDWKLSDDSILNSSNEPKIDSIDENTEEIFQDRTEFIDKYPLTQVGDSQSDAQILVEFLRTYCAFHPDCDDEILAVELGKIA